ncbi:MAG: DUF6913 domain-containing protein [Bacteroidales bacterium]
MKYWAVRRELKRMIEQPRKGVFTPLNSVRRIHLLFPYGEYAFILPIIDRLSKRKIEVVAWCIVHKSAKPEPLPKSVRVVSANEFSFWGTPSKALIDEVETLECDVFIDLNSSYSYRALLLAAHSKAKFRVGVHREGAPLYDFELILKERLKAHDIFHSMLDYLENIG